MPGRPISQSTTSGIHAVAASTPAGHKYPRAHANAHVDADPA